MEKGEGDVARPFQFRHLQLRPESGFQTRSVSLTANCTCTFRTWSISRKELGCASLTWTAAALFAQACPSSLQSPSATKDGKHGGNRVMSVISWSGNHTWT